MSYIISSGWWCDRTQVHPGSRRNASDNRIRSREFFDVWYDCIKTYTSPEKIIVIDSASPIKPKTRQDVEFVSLKRNFLHAEGCETRLTGWTRAFLTGAFYALMNDTDYSVFVEQDCAVVGGGIVEQAIAEMEGRGKKISYGKLDGMGSYIEQSFVIIKNDYILEFIEHYLAIPKTDNVFDGMSPEIKFRTINEKDTFWYPLPFGYGRNRPINFQDATFYAQQMTTDELRRLHDITQFASIGRLLAKES
jgi:hypothetical protein